MYNPENKMPGECKQNATEKIEVTPRPTYSGNNHDEDSQPANASHFNAIHSSRLQDVA